VKLSGALVVLLGSAAAPAQAHRLEKHFPVDGRAVVTVSALVRGRVEVKSWKNPEVVVISNHTSDKLEIDTEQVQNRIEVASHVLDTSAQGSELEATFDITVPEETELQVRTGSGTIYVERVYGDMTFDTVAGDVHLKEVAGYVIIRTVGGSVLCVQCAGKLNISSISGNIDIREPALNNLDVYSTSGNIYYDGQFLSHGIYKMRTGTGWVEVRFSDTDSFDLRASTQKGRVDNQAEDYLKPDKRFHFPSKFVKGIIGSVNAGLARVEVSSFNGTIRLRKRD
jgi:DUF4097 and DUF4098 domain-containing protein YvlB